jgi:hypothetical protein
VPKPFFKYPWFMLILLTIIVALIFAVIRQRSKDKK